MAGLYFVTLAVLVLAAFFAGRARARGLASSAGSISLHSLPVYHGLLAAVAVLVPMLVVYVIATPVVSAGAEKHERSNQRSLIRFS